MQNPFGVYSRHFILLILSPQQNDYDYSYVTSLFHSDKPYVPFTYLFQIYLNVSINKITTNSQY